ncbi:MAG: zeta toxin family protein [Bacteroidales bacterium]|jgi:adenylate kinase family enzyme|nr:zeta toxin family protein [Bacteroidales bacterium]
MSYDFNEIVESGKLSPEQNEAIYAQKQIFAQFKIYAQPQEHPIAICIGGQPGSGKTSVSGELSALQGGYIRIDSDALRQFHPLFEAQNRANDRLTGAYTSHDSGVWAQKMMKEALNKRMNIVFENPLTNTDKLLSRIDMLNTAGYSVRAKMFVVSYDLTFLGVCSRYERSKKELGFGRFVHEEPLKKSLDNQIKTVVALQQQGKLDAMELRSRDSLIFSGNYRTADIAGVMKAEQTRKFSSEEVLMLKNKWANVCQMMIERGAHKREFERISRQMQARISVCLKEQYPAFNVNHLINIKNDFNRTFQKVHSLSNGISF